MVAIGKVDQWAQTNADVKLCTELRKAVLDFAEELLRPDEPRFETLTAVQRSFQLYIEGNPVEAEQFMRVLDEAICDLPAMADSKQLDKQAVGERALIVSQRLCENHFGYFQHFLRVQQQCNGVSYNLVDTTNKCFEKIAASPARALLRSCAGTHEPLVMLPLHAYLLNICCC